MSTTFLLGVYMLAISQPCSHATGFAGHRRLKDRSIARPSAGLQVTVVRADASWIIPEAEQLITTLLRSVLQQPDGCRERRSVKQGATYGWRGKSAARHSSFGLERYKTLLKPERLESELPSASRGV